MTEPAFEVRSASVIRLSLADYRDETGALLTDLEIPTVYASTYRQSGAVALPAVVMAYDAPGAWHYDAPSNYHPRGYGPWNLYIQTLNADGILQDSFTGEMFARNG